MAFLGFRYMISSENTALMELFFVPSYKFPWNSIHAHKRGWRLCLQNYLAKRIRQKFWQFSRSQKHYSGLKDTQLIQQIKSTHSQLMQIIISNQLKCNSYKVIAWWELTPKDERMYPSHWRCEFIQRVALWQNIYWIISPLAAFRWKKGSRDVDSVF